MMGRIIHENPDIVGVTGTTPEYQSVMTLLRRIKKTIPGVKTVVGGAHATHVPWVFVDDCEELDYVVIYEGEKSMVAIAQGDKDALQEYSNNAQRLLRKVNLQAPERYQGRVILGPNQTTEDLERIRPLRILPFIDMSPYRYVDPEFGLVQTESIETARGCPFGCAFCSSARSGLGMRSIDNVLEELDLLDRQFKAKDRKGFVIFLDDTLTFRACQLLK